MQDTQSCKMFYVLHKMVEWSVVVYPQLLLANIGRSCMNADDQTSTYRPLDLALNQKLH